MTPTLTDYITGNAIRPATREEWQRSKDAATTEPGGTGAFILDGRIVFVAGDFPTPAPAPKHRLRCTFIPQAWVNKYAVTVDPEGPTSWDTDWFGSALPVPNSDESDQLRDVADAPRWVKDWSGPFEVEYEVIPDIVPPPGGFVSPPGFFEAPTPAPTAHTPEPWSIMHGGGDTYLTVSDDNLGLIAAVPLRGHYPADANAARIVAAVNACAGIADPAAAIAAARAVLKDLVQSYGESAFGAWRALELLGEK